MGDIAEYCESIAQTVSDYRPEEPRRITPGRVKSWIRQFDPEDQLVILQEIDRILKRFYFSRERVKTSLRNFIRTNLIGEEEPSSVLQRTHFLHIQRKGSSQRDLLTIVNEILLDDYCTTLHSCGCRQADTFVYIDDAVLTGSRLRYDLTPGTALPGFEPNPSWITTEAPPNCTLKIFVLVAHTEGANYAMKYVRQAASDKNIAVTTHCAMRVANERTIGCESHDCLWPQYVVGNEDVDTYIARAEHEAGRSIFFRPRGTPRQETLFSSSLARDTVERAFLAKGVKLMSSTNIKSMRPLGYDTLTSLGFGTFFVTYRNIPNNAPLVLWWSGGGRWFPLFKRRDSDQQRTSSSWWGLDDFDFPF